MPDSKPTKSTKSIADIIIAALAANGITATTGQFSFTPRWIHADMQDGSPMQGGWDITITTH